MKFRCEREVLAEAFGAASRASTGRATNPTLSCLRLVLAGELLRVKYPRITVGHGAEHVVSLFFKDVYEKVCNPCNAISFVHCR